MPPSCAFKNQLSSVGPLGELNPGPLAPKARIIPLDQADAYTGCQSNYIIVFHLFYRFHEMSMLSISYYTPEYTLCSTTLVLMSKTQDDFRQMLQKKRVASVLTSSSSSLNGKSNMHQKSNPEKTKRSRKEMPRSSGFEKKKTSQETKPSQYRDRAAERRHATQQSNPNETPEDEFVPVKGLDFKRLAQLKQHQSVAKTSAPVCRESPDPTPRSRTEIGQAIHDWILTKTRRSCFDASRFKYEFTLMHESESIDALPTTIQKSKEELELYQDNHPCMSSGRMKPTFDFATVRNDEVGQTSRRKRQVAAYEEQERKRMQVENEKRQQWQALEAAEEDIFPESELMDPVLGPSRGPAVLGPAVLGPDFPKDSAKTTSYFDTCDRTRVEEEKGIAGAVSWDQTIEEQARKERLAKLEEKLLGSKEDAYGEYQGTSFVYGENEDEDNEQDKKKKKMKRAEGQDEEQQHQQRRNQKFNADLKKIEKLVEQKTNEKKSQ